MCAISPLHCRASLDFSFRLFPPPPLPRDPLDVIANRRGHTKEKEEEEALHRRRHRYCNLRSPVWI